MFVGGRKIKIVRGILQTFTPSNLQRTQTLALTLR